ASDTLVYSQGTNQMLVLFNTTASPVIVTLLGNAVVAISPPGYGGMVSVAAGTAQTVPATSTLVIPLDKYSAFLQGTSVAVTNGTGTT
ncbi:hypothetical protein M3M33_14920, partial [Loigolactobacillus coryniformis]|uniref:hypothetical protein n=1 Tax=Loigolactobacillus coryniformis TaxID=1610 RepID=UPI00201B1157